MAEVRAVDTTQTKKKAGMASNSSEVYVQDANGEYPRLPGIHYQTNSEASPHTGRTWQQAAEVLFNVIPLEHGTFSASMTVYRFSRFLFCHGRADSADYRRDRARLKWCDLDHFLLHIPLQQHVVVSSGVKIRPLDVVLVDLAQPASFRLYASEALSMIIPRIALLPVMGAPYQGHGLVINRETASGVILSRLLLSLAAVAPQLKMEEAVGLSCPVLGLVAACLTRASKPDEAVSHFRQSNPASRVRTYIEHNLNRSDLTPAFLAKELGISRSQLYRGFEAFGGVCHYIRFRRLRRCLFALCDPAQAGRRIGDLAYDHGFRDETHFSRLFRDAFGLSPRGARAAIRGGDCSLLATLIPTSGDTPTFASWVSELTSC